MGWKSLDMGMMSAEDRARVVHTREGIVPLLNTEHVQ